MIVPVPVAALPLHDPQFWIATAMVAGAGVLALRRVRRTLRAESETPCASCPKARAALAPAAPRRRRLPVLPAALLAALVAGGGARAERVERQVGAMGTTLRVEVDAAARGAALEAAERAVREVEAAERRLSTWRDDSELAALERAPVGVAVALSAATAADLAGALRCAEQTGGAFDPTVAPLVRAFGLRTGGRWPSAAELEAARSRVGAGRLRLEDAPPGPPHARKLAPVAIEEGGFGKGAALDAALAAAERAAAGPLALRLDLGGQLAWSGGGPGPLELADPRRRSRGAVELRAGAGQGSLASSGNGERGRLVDGRALGHLLDPRTGLPAEDFGSVAVLDASALRADCLSTALFVLGPARGLAWLAAHGAGAEAVYLIVEGERLRARPSPGLAGRLRALAPEVIVEPEGRKPEGESAAS